jgi:hypothetical protein
VTERLAAVGLELASGDGHWVARARDADLRDGFEPIFALDQLELAALAVLYLHLRYLPRQNRQADEEQPSVAVEDIERGLPGYKVSKVQMVLGRLKNAHFVRQQNGRLLLRPLPRDARRRLQRRQIGRHVRNRLGTVRRLPAEDE